MGNCQNTVNYGGAKVKSVDPVAGKTKSKNAKLIKEEAMMKRASKRRAKKKRNK